MLPRPGPTPQTPAKTAQMAPWPAAISVIFRLSVFWRAAAIRRAWTFRPIGPEAARLANPRRPAIDRNLHPACPRREPRHPDQQPPLGRLSDDGVKRAASPQMSMEECRRRGPVQGRKHLLGTQAPRRPGFQGRQSLMRMRRPATIIERAEKCRLKMIGASKPVACAHRHGSGTGFDDRGNAIGVEQ
jgi:hypothetical protein